MKIEDKAAKIFDVKFNSCWIAETYIAFCLDKEEFRKEENVKKS